MVLLTGPHTPLLLGVASLRAPAQHSVCSVAGWGLCSWWILLQRSLLPQASRDLAQMNDLQAQLEEANKEKQELQEKVGTRVFVVERGCGATVCGNEPPSSWDSRRSPQSLVIQSSIKAVKA